MIVPLAKMVFNYTKINAMRNVQMDHISHLLDVCHAQKDVIFVMINIAMSATRVEGGN